MHRVNRTFLFVYDILVALAFILKAMISGPVLFSSTWCFWLTLTVVMISLIALSYFTFCHPTPLEIVAYHVTLIMRHPIVEGEQAESLEYDEQNKLYLSDHFIESQDYKFFYYGDCCAKTNQYHRMKIKLASGEENFNHVSIIIKTVDDQYIRFNLIKQTEISVIAFLYDWEINKIEYSDSSTFDRMVRGTL